MVTVTMEETERLQEAIELLNRNLRWVWFMGWSLTAGCAHSFKTKNESLVAQQLCYDSQAVQM